MKSTALRNGLPLMPSDRHHTPLKQIASHPPRTASPQPRAKRHTLLIRAAKLVSPNGEFLCVIRDISETGVRLRLFHEPPSGTPLELHMPDDSVYQLEQVWHKDSEAGFKFAAPINLAELVAGSSQFPKRPLRLNLFLPIEASSLTSSGEGLIENLSQQGARFSCDAMYAVDQTVRIKCPEAGAALTDVSAKVRWRRGNDYGVVFENTLSLQEFARLAAFVQCPDLLDTPTQPAL